MVQYIKELALEIANGQNLEINIDRMFKEIAKEIERLDTRDFLPDIRADFVKIRAKVNFFSEFSAITRETKNYKSFGKKLLEILDAYQWEGSHIEKKEFTFIVDSDLRNIIERDYKELSLILLPSGAWKSTIIMSGSILEAILNDLLSSNPTRAVKATASSKAPKKHGTVIPFEKWKLESLIQVSEDIDLLPPSRAKSIDQILRDYRNFVHPKKEIRTGHPCTEAEALMAKGALDSVYNNLIDLQNKGIL